MLRPEDQQREHSTRARAQAELITLVNPLKECYALESGDAPACLPNQLALCMLEFGEDTVGALQYWYTPAPTNGSSTFTMRQPETSRLLL